MVCHEDGITTLLTCMLAHFSYWHLKIKVGKKSTVHDSIAAKKLD